MAHLQKTRCPRCRAYSSSPDAVGASRLYTNSSPTRELAGTTVNRHQSALPPRTARTAPTRRRRDPTKRRCPRPRRKHKRNDDESASTSSSPCLEAVRAGSRRRSRSWRCPSTRGTSRGCHCRIASPWVIIWARYRRLYGFWRCGAAGIRENGPRQFTFY